MSNYHNKYIKYQITYSLIKQILQKLNKQKIVFFIDLQSICKGLYNKNNIFFELKYYIEYRQPSDTLIQEYRNFLNKLYTEFKQYTPYMVTFVDNGRNTQNLSISSGYKSGRSSISDVIHDDQELQLYYKIKALYFKKIESKFTKSGYGHVYHLGEYESDLIPYYCITNNLFNSGESDTLNVILSTDKDLLQCCEFKNTIQCINRFFPSQTGSKKMKIDVYDDNNAISYIYNRFKPGGLTSKYIPMILAISGDKSDNINGLKGYGPSKTIHLIENFNIPSTLWELKKYHHENKLPSIISKEYDKKTKELHFNIITRNLKMISFEEQLKRTNIINIRGGNIEN